MKSVRKDHISPLFRLAASLLMVIFLSIPVLQASHLHSEPSKTGTETVVYAKCPTCDYLVHTQQKHSFDDQAPVLIHFAQKPATVYFSFNCKIFPAAIQGYTNKGPPVIS